jgi:uncharacterized protein
MPELADLVAGLSGFEWDEGNANKNWERHGLSRAEAEQVFLNAPIVLAAYVGHSSREQRFGALGRTSADRLLAIVFTIRGDLLRVISARPMSRRERKLHVKVPPEAP